MRSLALLLLFCALASCTARAPLPASVTVRGSAGGDAAEVSRRIRVDGLVEALEWAGADTVGVLLPDGREILVLRRRGPASLDFAFLGLGGTVSRNIQPEILLDVSGTFPAQFGRQTWWFRIAPSRCVARASVDELDCGVELTGFEASSPPRDRQDNLEVSIGFSLLEYNPTTTPVIALALRFAEDPEVQDASWPLQAELRRPDTWAVIDLGQ